MRRRTLLRAFGGMAICPICAGLAQAQGAHWSYEGATGPDKWGWLSAENVACAVGSQQSPLNLTGGIKADLPPIRIAWNDTGGSIVNNCHTIQINVPSGSTLELGQASCTLVQYHFHAPSEHRLENKGFPMEAHFVHANAARNGYTVIGVFMEAGDSNPAFAKITATMPREPERTAPTDADPRGLLPRTLEYWRYAGSLTTPPCSEMVDWLVLSRPSTVTRADIERFTALYPMNARPLVSSNRRFLLRSA